MRKQIQNYTVELRGDLITIKKDGRLIKAFTVKPLDAVDKYKKFINKVEALLGITA